MLPLGHPPLVVSTSRPLDQSCPSLSQPIFSSPAPPSSANPNVGLHRRRGSTATECSPIINSPITTDLTKSAASGITYNPATLGSSSYPQLGLNYPETPSQQHIHIHNHNIKDQTDLTLNNNESANHFTTGFGHNSNSLATLGSNSYADTEAGVIGNQSNKTASDILQSKTQNASALNGCTDIPEDGSGANKKCTTIPRTLNNGSSHHEPTPHQPVKQSRLQSLDILRGITIVFMVLVNTQGADPFTQLAHSDWFGYTLADWVFPNFIFMVGIAIAIVLSPKKLALMSIADSSASNENRITTSTSSKPSFWKRYQTRIKMSLRILKRSILLFAIGIFLASFELIGESVEDRWLRIPGVLQRISFCYFILATAVLWAPVTCKKDDPVNSLFAIFDMPASAPTSSYHPSRIVQIALPLICTALWFILTFAIQSTATLPISDCLFTSAPQSSSSQVIISNRLSRGQLTPQWCTAQAYLDTVLFAKWHDPNHPVFDSEGSIGSLMAVVTAWFGWMIGNGIMEQQQNQKSILNRLSQELKAKSKTISNEDDDSDSIRLSQQKREIASKKCVMDILDAQLRLFLLTHLGRWFMAGVCIMFSGVVIGWFLPICKGLWTPSFTLYSAGISINALCILMYLYDVPQPKSQSSSEAVLSTLEEVVRSCGRLCTHLLICYGRNPTLIYVLTDLVKIILEKIRVDGGQDWIQTACV
ncbi:hypothetical protein BGZ76_006297 [Entomortierella beljakovae]|nr:hypothetical protein BGZ76_006297 [Entomortierella beljakovae]